MQALDPRTTAICAHCRRLIARLCVVADAGGRESVVGTDCVRRACESGRLLDEMERELRHARKLEAAERHEARRLACLAVLRADPGFLADRPHPDAWRTDQTMRDQVLWLFRTQAGRNAAFGIIEGAWPSGGRAGSRRRNPGRPSILPLPGHHGRRAMTEQTTRTTQTLDVTAEVERPRRHGSGTPAEWHDGVTRLQAMPPLGGFPPDRWRQVQQDAARLLDEHGGELDEQGWTVTDLFGVHPTAPGVAIYCVGLAVVPGGARVVEVTPEHAAFVRPSGARLTFVRRPASEAVPLWTLGV